jgi:hypothetical protein
MVVVFIAGSDVVLSHEILGAFVLVRSAIVLVPADGFIDVA